MFSGNTLSIEDAAFQLPKRDSNRSPMSKDQPHFAIDIWKKAAPNITSLELENPQSHYLLKLTPKFSKLDHLKFTGTLSDCPSRYITPSRFPNISYLEFHKIRVDASGPAMMSFMESEVERYQNISDLVLPPEHEERSEFMGIRCRFNYRYHIMNEILQSLSQLKVFRYFDDGALLNQMEMEMMEWNNRFNAQNAENTESDGDEVDNNDIGSASFCGTKYVTNLRAQNGRIVFPESLEFISLINCDCAFDFSACRNVIALHLFGINYSQIVQWPMYSVIQCLVTSTQSEMTEDWNDIFENVKYRITDLHSKRSSSSYSKFRALPTLPSLKSVSALSSALALPHSSVSCHSIPVRFMKRITNRTLSPVETPVDGNEVEISAFNLDHHSSNTALSRSTSTMKPAAPKREPFLSPMIRIKSAGSNDNGASGSTPGPSSPADDEKGDSNHSGPPSKIYVENKLNKTKSLNKFNDHILEEMNTINVHLRGAPPAAGSGGPGHGGYGLDGLGLGETLKNYSFSSPEDWEENGVMTEIKKIKMEPMSKQRKSGLFDVFEEYRKMKFMVEDKELMCMEIEDDGEIFYRLITTLYEGTPDVMKHKVEMYEKWWSIKIAGWISKLGDDVRKSLPKRQRNLL